MAASSTNQSSISQEYFNEYNGTSLVGVAVAFTVLEIVFVALRFTARYIGKIAFASDDILMIPALALCLGINSVAIAMVQYASVGHHIPYILLHTPSSLVLWAKFLITTSFLYLVAVVLPKLAILTIYLRVFPTPLIRWSCYTLGTIMTLTAVIGLFFAGLGCRPMSYFWDKSTPTGGTCVDIHALYLWTSFPNILTDLVMLILPLPMVWTLSLPAGQKVALTCTFLTGSIGLASSIVRFVSFATIDPLSDGTWASVTLMEWTIIEPGAYLIVACLPTLRPLCRVLTGRTAGRTAISAAPTSAERDVGVGAGAGASFRTRDSGGTLSPSSMSAQRKSRNHESVSGDGSGLGRGKALFNIDEDYFELVEDAVRMSGDGFCGGPEMMSARRASGSGSGGSLERLKN